jgi:hypothetical protein
MEVQEVSLISIFFLQKKICEKILNIKTKKIINNFGIIVNLSNHFLKFYQSRSLALLYYMRTWRLLKEHDGLARIFNTP